jgi:predicted phosphodiesterase
MARSSKRRLFRGLPLALRAGLASAAVLLLALAGLWLGVRLAGPVSQETRLGAVSLRVKPALTGTVDVFVPIANWGVRANAFSAPLQLHVEPRSANRQAVIAAAAGDDRILTQARHDAGTAARHALVRALVWGVAGAVLVGLLAALIVGARGRRRRAALLGVATVVVATAIGLAAILRADATFDANAFENPHFYARGAELAQLLKVAEKAQSEGLGYSSAVDRTLSGYASLVQAGARFDRVPATPPAILMSDLHGNTLVLDALKRLAAGAGPIFFAGDFGQAGTAAEVRLLVQRVVAIGRPFVAVSGNHDSALMMRALEAAGATVLTEDDGVHEINGLRVAGYSDPLESRTGRPDDPSRIFSFAERPDGDAEFAAVQQRIIEWFRGLEPRPDVVLIHENGLAQGLARALAESGDTSVPLLILTGHDHKQHVDVYGNVLVADAGTVGAGGIFGAGRAPIGVAQLHFDLGTPQLRAIDLVEFEPISGMARADRIVVGSPAACEVDGATCHPPATG